ASRYQQFSRGLRQTRQQHARLRRRVGLCPDIVLAAHRQNQSSRWQPSIDHLQILRPRGSASRRRDQQPVDRFPQHQRIAQRDCSATGLRPTERLQLRPLRGREQAGALAPDQQGFIGDEAFHRPARRRGPGAPIERIHEVEYRVAAKQVEAVDAQHRGHTTTIPVDWLAAKALVSRPMQPPGITMQAESPSASFTRAGVWQGMKLTLPYSVSALPFGLAFGAAAGALMSPAEAGLMSALVFAGAAQFAVLS